MVTVQSRPAGSVADAAVKVTVAVAVPELLATALNVVEPQPTAVGVVSVSKMNRGTTTAMVLVAYKGAFNSNMKDIGVTP